jgi:competence protein ComEC
MVIDTGNSFKTKHRKLSLGKYLQKNNVKNIQKVLITHAHIDHYGGLSYLAENFVIDTLIVAKSFLNSNVANKIMEDKNFENTQFLIVDDSLAYKNSNYELFFMHNNEIIKSDNPNNSSLVTKLSIKGLSILFTGDIEQRTENFLINNYSHHLKCDIIKIPHHGRITSTSKSFLDAVQPEISFISSSKNNYGGSSNPTIINRIYNIDSKLFITGRDGTIAVKMN